LTSKIKTVRPKTARPEFARGRGSDRQTTVDYNYNDFFRFEVEHGYDFERSTRPFSPISAKLDVSPVKYVWLDADAQYSVYENEFLSHNIQGLLWDNRGDELYVDYRYEKQSEETNNNENIQSITGKIRVKLTDYLSVNAENVYNLETDQRIRTAGGFTYTAQCWSFDFKYTNEPDDWKVSFKIGLTGLGEIEY
jgi:LPS-assembly protein